MSNYIYNLPRDMQTKIIIDSGNCNTMLVSRDWNSLWKEFVAPFLQMELQASMRPYELMESASLVNLNQNMPSLLREMVQKAQCYVSPTLCKDILRSPASLEGKFTALFQEIHKERAKAYEAVITASVKQFPSIKEKSKALAVYSPLERIEKMRALFDEISGLGQLSLSKKDICLFPEEAAQKCTSLRLLDLSEIPSPFSLPPSLWRMKSLKGLHLAKLGLVRLPQEVGCLKGLSLSYNKGGLHLENNRLTTLPPEIANLPLNSVFIDKNPIVYLPSCVLQCLESSNASLWDEYAFSLGKDLSYLKAIKMEKALLPLRLQFLLHRAVAMTFKEKQPGIYTNVKRSGISYDLEVDHEGHMVGQILMGQFSQSPLIGEARERLIKKMESLYKLQERFTASDLKIGQQLELLLELLHFDTEGILFDQQIVEVIKFIDYTSSIDSYLPTMIGGTIKSAFGFKWEKSGWDKFLLRARDSKVKSVVICALQKGMENKVPMLEGKKEWILQRMRTQDLAQPKNAPKPLNSDFGVQKNSFSEDQHKFWQQELIKTEEEIKCERERVLFS